MSFPLLHFLAFLSELHSGPSLTDLLSECDIVQADHAPEAGVAQGIFHGILVRHHGRIQEEVEEGLEEEVERRGEENTQEQVRMPMTMDGNEDTQTRLEPHVTV